MEDSIVAFVPPDATQSAAERSSQPSSPIRESASAPIFRGGRTRPVPYEPSMKSKSCMLFFLRPDSMTQPSLTLFSAEGIVGRLYDIALNPWQVSRQSPLQVPAPLPISVTSRLKFAPSIVSCIKMDMAKVPTKLSEFFSFLHFFQVETFFNFHRFKPSSPDSAKSKIDRFFQNYKLAKITKETAPQKTSITQGFNLGVKG